MPDASRWQRVKDLFEAARDRPADVREAFLGEACADDPDVRREVASLLAAHREAGDFLSQPGLSTHDTPDVHGQRIGPYRLLGTVGLGGMGVVYRAVRDDDVFHKTVALKLVHGGADPEHLRRLGRERRILARLQHPNIATILDGGTTAEGQPYLVMEYVEGEPIDAYCRGRGLGTRERLEMFRTVCGAVHYAHQNLVVHRDLKPQNILVTADGQPKLLDFGIAKLLAPDIDPSDAPTATLLPAMTPEYASPEQVRGQAVTTASDVYSLGVVLYELLTGRRPYAVRAASLQEIVQVICETEPPLPSVAIHTAPPGTTRPTIVPSDLRGDLDTIVLKALRKEPSRRYLSAQEMSEDVRRHLAGLPVLARKDTLGYRTGKFVGRHRVAVTAGGLVFASLLVGMLTTARQARIAEANRVRAERRFADVRKLADSFLFEIHDVIAGLPGSIRARELIVKHVVEYLDTLTAESEGDAALRRELAIAYERVANVQGNPRNANLGDTAGALASARKALVLREALCAANPLDGELRRGLAASVVGLGDLQLMMRDLSGSAESYRRALAIYEAVSAAAPDDRQARLGLATAHSRVGDVLNALGNRPAAIEAHRKALAIWEPLAVADPGDLDVQNELVSAHDALGDALREEDDLQAALASHRRAVAIAEALSAANPTNVRARYQTATCYADLGNTFADLDDLPRALESSRKALAIVQAIAAADPKDAEARWLEGLNLNSVGDHLRELGQAAEALGLHESALALFKTLSEADPDNASYRYNVANTHQLLGLAHQALASKAKASAGERSRHWRDACSSFEQSAASFDAMRQRGTMSAQLAPDVAKVDEGLVTCRTALARSQSR